MLRRLKDDRRGVAAVEFALIAPVMILLYYGLAEVTLGMMAGRRAAHAAAVVGDLVAQSGQMDAAQMDDIFEVGDAVMKPFPASGLQMRVTSVKADAQAAPKVVWSRGAGMSGLSQGATAADVPSGLLDVGESVVMAEVRYTWNSPLNKTINEALSFNQRFYLRPRKASEVAWVS